MKILSWNVRGTGQKGFSIRLVGYLESVTQISSFHENKSPIRKS